MNVVCVSDMPCIDINFGPLQTSFANFRTKTVTTKRPAEPTRALR